MPLAPPGPCIPSWACANCLALLCPPREKGESGCLIFPGRASSQTTSPCCPCRPGRLLHSQLPRTVDTHQPHTPLPFWVTVLHGIWSEEASRGWGPNAEVPSLSYRRHVMSQEGGTLHSWSCPAHRTNGWSPAVPEEGRNRPALPRFTPLLQMGLPWVGGLCPTLPPSHQHLGTSVLVRGGSAPPSRHTSFGETGSRSSPLVRRADQPQGLRRFPGGIPWRLES